MGLKVKGMQVLRDNFIVHEVFGIFLLPGDDVMCACNYVKERGNVGHDRNKLEIIETTTQNTICLALLQTKAHVLPP